MHKPETYRLAKSLMVVLTAAAASTMAPFAHAAAPSELDNGKLALADDFAVAARRAIDQPSADTKAATDLKVQRTAALLRAACDEWPFDPRFPRLLAEACRELNDPSGELDALNKYRSIQLPEVQNDQFATVRVLDLYTDQQENEDKKIAYLEHWRGRQSLPDPVRSHIDVALAGLYAQKFRSKDARDMIDEAIKLNPVNPEALQAKYAQTQVQGSLKDQVDALLALLKSNPAQPAVMGTLASDLASLGDPDVAVDWYQRSFDLGERVGTRIDPGQYTDMAAELELMGQPRKSSDAATKMLSANPANARAASLLLFIARQEVYAPVPGSAALQKDAITHANKALLAAITAEIGSMDAEMNGVTGAASTQPAATQPADLLSIIERDSPRLLAFNKDPKVTVLHKGLLEFYVASLANLTWYYTYFDPQPDKAQRILAVLKPLRPAGDAEVTRLEGYLFFAQGNKGEAKVKWSAVATADPMAKMGLILLDDGPNAAADASKLIGDHPAGLLALQLIDGLRGKGGKLQPDSDAQAAADASRAFPSGLLDLLSPGSAQKFYSVLAQPLRVANGYDEPELVNIVIQNVGDYDLPIASDGALHSNLWFDVNLQGGNNENFYGVAIDRIAGPLVLKAHHMDLPGTSQTLRVDQGELADYLRNHPTAEVSLLFSVVTNPIGQSSSVVPGPGGYRAQFASPMERLPSPIETQQDVTDVANPAINGKIAERIHTLQLLADYVKYLRDNSRPPANVRSAADAPGLNGAGGGGVDAGAGGEASSIGGLPGPGNETAGNETAGNDTASGSGAGSDIAGSDTYGAAPSKPRFTEAEVKPKIDVFVSTIQAALHDPTPIVRYFAQFQAGMISSDDGDRMSSAIAMTQGADWEQRVLGLMLAATLPPAREKQVSALLVNDPVAYVKSLAQATAALADMPPEKKKK